MEFMYLSFIQDQSSTTKERLFNQLVLLTFEEQFCHWKSQGSWWGSGIGRQRECFLSPISRWRTKPSSVITQYNSVFKCERWSLVLILS
jgi:hypothetical protein